MNPRWTVLALAPLLAACVSAPDYRYYTLDMRPSGTITGSARLDSVQVRAGEALSKNEILIRTSPTQVEYYALDRWASGLEEQIAEKLLTEFSGADRGAPALWLEADLLAFEQVDTGTGAEARVKMDVRAGWQGDGRRATDLHRMYVHSEPAGAAQPREVVEALSRCVEAIAAEIAAEPALQPEHHRGVENR